MAQGARAAVPGAWRAGVACALLVLLAHAAPALAGRHPESRAPGRAEVRGLDLSASADSAALTIELDRATEFRLFTLSRPERVVLDLADSRLGRGAHLPPPSGMVHTVRTGLRAKGALRIVLELDARATPHAHRALPVHAHWIARRRRGASRLVVTVGAADAAGVAGASVTRSARAQVAEPPHVIRAAHAPVHSDRDVVIAVDAGHGGKDPGAIGHHGTEEKNVTLAIARALAARIDAEPGMRAVLTRDSDVYLKLRERIQRARAARANLFVSIHADSIRDRNVSGASVYILSEHGATDEAARWLAERENAADLIDGVSLADKNRTLASVLLDLSQSANISASMTAAKQVLTALDHLGDVRKSTVQQAGFVVLKSPDIPSLLVETAYISNPADERRLRMPREQRRLADAIFSGLLDYFEDHPPAGTRFARLRGHADEVLAGGVAPASAAAATP